MKEFLDKLASYHLFNYLLPGALFVILSSKLINYNLYQTDIVYSLVLYYFIGLVISRIGSLVVGPLLRTVRFINFAEYEDFINASKNDPKIELFSETNNMFRTLLTLFLLLFLLKIYSLIESTYQILRDWNEYILLGLLFVIFLFAYKRQTGIIVQRIKANKEKKTKARVSKNQ